MKSITAYEHPFFSSDARPSLVVVWPTRFHAASTTHQMNHQRKRLRPAGVDWDFSTRRAIRFSRCLGLLWMAAMLLGCKPSKSTPTPESRSPDGPIRLGYVLHGLNQFTETIAQGAKDAGLAAGVSVEVVGPAGFSTTSDAIALFEGLALKKVDGLVVIPMPGEVWVTPIRQAVERGIPVLTANVTSEGSKARTWFGQDEFGSGVILANELQKLLKQQNKTEGTIVVGMCAPGVSVLVERYEGFKKGMAGSRFQITQPFDVNTEDSANYSAWENLVGANPKMVAIVGLCSMDLPNLAKLKKRTNGDWLVAGYDLSRETLDAVKTGTVQIVLGQHPYLQGNLPILALTRHLRDKQPLPEGWIDVGTEVITKQNVESIYRREVDNKQQTQWYAEYIGRNFTNLQAIAKPLPGSRR